MLGNVLGELVALFGVTYVSKKILEAAGKKTIAGVIALGGYCLTGVQAIKAIVIIKGMLTSSVNSFQENFNAGDIANTLVDKIVEGVKGAIIK